MPTHAVHPHDGESLQAIADALVKAKKVVVVTGAGISTNSGIPDFRSENGLYRMIQEQYEAAARAPPPQPSGPKPESRNAAEDPISEEFPEDRPKKRQKLSQADNEEPQVLPEITVGEAACADGGQRGEGHDPETRVEGEITCATGAALPAPLAKEHQPVLPQIKTTEEPCRRASSLPPVRRRSARLNREAQDIALLEASLHCPAQPAGLEVPSTPTKTRRQTISTIHPGSSSPLSDAPSEVSSPSKIFDLPSLLRTSSPLSDLPSELGISSPFFERPAFRPGAFPSSSSLLSDPPSHLASSPFLDHLAPVRSSPLSDPPAYLPSSPPIANRRTRVLSLKSLSPLSSPPHLNPDEECDSRQNASRGGSPSPETRQPLKSQDTSTSNSSSAREDSSSLGDESSRSGSCDCSGRDHASDRQHETQVSEEIHCAPGPPTRCESLSQQASINASQSREADEPTSSNPVSSQGSTTSARLPIPNIKGRDLFDASIWACPIRTSVFYTFATTLRQRVRDVTPTSSHVFISHLRDRGKLVRCYTQNIDRIEEKVGLSTALERGPGHRSRFSRRAPALSRGQSTASEATAPSDVLHSTAPAAQGAADSIRATDSCDQAHGQGKEVHERRDRGDPESSREGRPGPDACTATDGNAAESARAEGSEASSGDSSNPGGPSSSQSSRGEAAQPSTAEGTQPGGPRSVNEFPPSERDNPPAASQESSEGCDTGTTARPKAAQRQSTPSSGVECVFLHGSLESLRCFRCRRVSEWDGLEDQTFVGEQPACPHCAGATAAREERGKRALGVGKLRPDIVLYGEEHPNAHLISPVVTHDLGLGPDLLLILGTSLKVHGLKVLVRQFAKAVHSKGGKVVFVNFTKPSESSWGDVIDYWVAWDCDAWVGDLKEKVPALWLPPGEEPKKRKSINTKGVEKKNGERKAPKRKSVSAKGGSKKDERKDEKTGAEIVVSSQESTIEVVAGTTTTAETNIDITEKAAASIVNTSPHTELPEHGQTQPDSQDGPKKDRPQQRRVNLREDKANGAYFTWKIMESLRSISGREAPPLMDLPSVTASRAIATAEATRARNERKRRSKMAAEGSQKQVTVTPVPVPQIPVSQMPEVWSIHSSVPPAQQGGAAAARPAAMPPPPPPAGRTTPAAPKTKRTPLPFDTHRTPSAPKSDPKPTPDSSIPARFDPRKRKLACLQPTTPTHLPTSPTSQPSILAAVKSNPRKRKRKTIDGEEVVLPTVNSRKDLSSADKENVEEGPKGVIPLSAQPMDGPIRLPPLRGVVESRWKPVPMEPVSSPRGPAESFEGEVWGRVNAERKRVGIGNAFFYEDLLGGLGIGDLRG